MAAGVWHEGPPPAGVEVGDGCSLELNPTAFKRFFSERRPGLVLGPRVTVYTWTTFSVERGGIVEVGAESVLVGANFMCAERITLGRRVIVSYNVAIADSDFHPHDADLRRQDAIANAPEGDLARRPPIPADPVTIEDDVRIGIGAVILKGVRIGAGAEVRAGAVVTRSVAPGTVVAGNPARELASG